MSTEISLPKFYELLATEQHCRDYLERLRWNGEVSCPRCDSYQVYKFADGRLYKCGNCRRQFTVRVGTIFEDSKLPLQKWFLAVYLATTISKGIGSVQLSRYLGVTQKSAWLMLQRIRDVTDSTSTSTSTSSTSIKSSYGEMKK